MVSCLWQGADLHVAQLMPLPLTISCSSKSRLVLPFSYWLTRVVPDKRPLNGCCCCLKLAFTTVYTFNPMDPRSRNTWMAVFVTIPRNRYNGFMTLELFLRDRDTGLFTFLQNMKIHTMSRGWDMLFWVYGVQLQRVKLMYVTDSMQSAITVKFFTANKPHNLLSNLGI